MASSSSEKMSHMCDKCGETTTQCDDQQCRDTMCLWCSSKGVTVCRFHCQGYFCPKHTLCVCDVCGCIVCKDCIDYDKGMITCMRCKMDSKKN